MIEQVCLRLVARGRSDVRLVRLRSLQLIIQSHWAPGGLAWGFRRPCQAKDGRLTRGFGLTWPG